jgi:hypothetical protein
MLGIGLIDRIRVVGEKRFHVDQSLRLFQYHYNNAPLMKNGAKCADKYPYVCHYVLLIVK